MNALAMFPDYCSICPKASTEHCTHCRDISYCSPTCRRNDAERHAPLCSTLKDYDENSRPSPYYSRCIFFPADAVQPRFVWLNYHGLPDQQLIDREHLRSYVTGVPSGGDAAFDCFREGNRLLPDRIIVRHDSNALGNKQPYNQCVMALLGQVAGEYWRGPLLAQSYKHRVNNGLYQWTGEDRVETTESLIPMDLGTGSLAPILSFLKWRATSTDDYNLSIAAADATPRTTTAGNAARRKTSPKKVLPKKILPKKASPQKKKKQKPVDEQPVKDVDETEIVVKWKNEPYGGWTKI